MGNRSFKITTAARTLALVVIVLTGIAAADGELDEAMLAKRRAAVRERVRQPILLEAQNFKLYFDRQDSTFRLEDGAGVTWNTSIGRRGFASILLKGDDGVHRKLPIDRVEDPRTTTRTIRFRGGSSQGDVPPLHFELRITAPLVGLELTVDAPPEFFAGGGAVEILDRALWVADTDDGGAVVPIGLGEWYPASSPTDFRRRLSPRRGSPGTLEGVASGVDTDDMVRPTLSMLGLKRGSSGLLVIWDHPDTIVEVTGEGVQDENFPGLRSLHTSVVLLGGARAIRLFPLGRLRELRDIPASYRQIINHPDPFHSLRYKTGFSRSHGRLLGAAVFTVGFADGSPWTGFRAVERAARRLHDDLQIDQALFIVKNWLSAKQGESRAAETGWAAAVRVDLGGPEALSRCIERLHAQEYLVGLELPPAWTDGPSVPDDVESRVLDLAKIFRPDLLLAPGEVVAGSAAGNWPVGFWDRHEALVESLTGKHVLLGAPFLDERQVRHACFLEGVLEHRLLDRAGGRFFPLLPAVYGRDLRLVTRSDDPLRPGEPEKFLSYLLLGEVPRYELVPASHDGVPQDVVAAGGDTGRDAARAVFSQSRGGWCDGTDLEPGERFLKNTYEVLSHLARLRFRTPLLRYTRLDSEGAVEEVFYGHDLRIVVNRGDTSYKDPEGQFVLPKYGFWIQHPFFVAFYARRAFEYDFEQPALFTIRSLEGKLWLRAEKVRIWHGFGPSHIVLGSKPFDVPRQLDTRIWK